MDTISDLPRISFADLLKLAAANDRCGGSAASDAGTFDDEQKTVPNIVPLALRDAG
jgi:hypothetical protein